MKKKFIATALFLAGAMTAGAQTYTTLGIGINPPHATLHVHSDSAISPEGGGDQTINPGNDPWQGPRSGGSVFQYDYHTTFRMTNGNTDDGGFVVRQDNLDITMYQYEAGRLAMRTTGGGINIESDGRVGIGLANSGYGFNVERTSRFAQDVLLCKRLQVFGKLTADSSLSVGGTFNVGSVLYTMGNYVNCHSLNVLHSQSVGGGLTVGGNMNLGGGLTVAGGQTTHGSLTVDSSLTVGDGLYCDAAGNMKVKHLRVTTEDWPDYVFGDGYRLRPLAEVEAYVKQHRHLPEVPAAAEVEQEGVDQGELNRVLMQKVEELTLYIIDLQKQIEELKNK